MSTPEAALITGCSEPNGFGACVALELARKGYRVFASARNIKSMKAMEGVCEVCHLTLRH
jgi:NADP-dependent 3-hydroxy acid dehydrogenase YdfG